MKKALLIGGGLVGAFLIYRAIIRKQEKNKPSMGFDGFSMNACGDSCGCVNCKDI